jgi:hypothetical protein
MPATSPLVGTLQLGVVRGSALRCELAEEGHDGDHPQGHDDDPRAYDPPRVTGARLGEEVESLMTA